MGYVERNTYRKFSVAAILEYGLPVCRTCSKHVFYGSYEPNIDSSFTFMGYVERIFSITKFSLAAILEYGLPVCRTCSEHVLMGS